MRESGRPSLPIIEDVLSAFVASLAKGVSYTSLRVYLSSLRHHQMESGKGDPDISQMVWLEHIIKGIKRWSSISLTHVIDFIDDDDLHEVLKFTSTLAAKYYQLGVAPGLKSTSLDKIRSDYAGNSDQALNEVRKEHQSINDNHSPLILFIRLKQSKTEQLRKASSKIRAIKLAK